MAMTARSEDTTTVGSTETGKDTPVDATESVDVEVSTDVDVEDVDTDDGDDTDEKIYSKEDMTEIVRKRYDRVKKEAIELKAAELAKGFKDEAESSKQELADALREVQVLRLASENGLSSSLLMKTGLKGEDLKAYVEELKAEKLTWANPAADFMNSAVKNFNGQGDWRADVLKQMEG